jgi:CheY-like chemotaxis protein
MLRGEEGRVTVRRVLVVEDQADLRELLKEGLREGGFEVVAAGGGPEGLEVYRTQGPCDVLLLDEELPGFSGRELLRMIRQRDADVPALIYSGSLVLTDDECRRLGVSLILRKPLPLAAVVAAIHSTLGER